MIDEASRAVRPTAHIVLDMSMCYNFNELIEKYLISVVVSICDIIKKDRQESRLEEARQIYRPGPRKRPMSSACTIGICHCSTDPKLNFEDTSRSRQLA